MRYVHTNIIARDWKALSAFYQKVFGCVPVPPRRDLRGEWLDRLTGIKDAHITGEHLALPGYKGGLPTLEILSYDGIKDEGGGVINRAGLTHIAFEAEDVEKTLEIIKEAGGGQYGEVVHAEYPGNVNATFVYASDIEGNIIELQNWKRGEV